MRGQCDEFSGAALGNGERSALDLSLQLRNGVYRRGVDGHDAQPSLSTFTQKGLSFSFVADPQGEAQ